MRELLDRAVRLRGVQVSRVVDVILAPETEEVLGFEVRCEDQRLRFLPAAAAKEHDGALDVASPFALLGAAELDFYRRRGRTLGQKRESAA